MKQSLRVLLALALCAVVVFASTTSGPNSSGTQADDSAVGVNAWSNPANAASSDDTYATWSNNTGEGDFSSHYLKCTNFGFSIPSGATVNGVLVEIEKREVSPSSSMQDKTVSLVKGGVVSGENKAAVTEWPTTEAYFSYGSGSDLWGLALTASDINASNFGVVLQVFDFEDAESGFAVVDHVRITVTYTAAAGPTTSQRSAGFFMQGAK